MSHVPYTRTSRRGRMVQLVLGLSVLPTAVLLPSAAVAASSDPSTKAQVEHAERQSASTPTKAQVEAAERATAPRPAGAPETAPSSGDRPTVPSGDDAAAWQLAASAALGAVLAGGVMVASRQITEHRRPLAS